MEQIYVKPKIQFLREELQEVLTISKYIGGSLWHYSTPPKNSKAIGVIFKHTKSDYMNFNLNFQKKIGKVSQKHKTLLIFLEMSLKKNIMILTTLRLFILY